MRGALSYRTIWRSAKSRLLVSSVFGQGIASVLLLFLGHDYGAAFVGKYAAIMAVAGFTSIFATLQLERLFVSQRAEEIAGAAWLMSCGVVSAMSLLFAAQLIWQAEKIYYLTILVIPCLAFYQFSYYVAVRSGALIDIANSKIIQGFTFAVGVVGFWALDALSVSVLLVVTSVSWVLSGGTLLSAKAVASFFNDVSFLFSRERVVKLFLEHFHFIIVTVPAMFFLVGSKDLAVIALDYFYSADIAGFYALLSIMLLQPIGLLGKIFSAEIGHLASIKVSGCLLTATRRISTNFILFSIVWVLFTGALLLLNYFLSFSNNYILVAGLFPIFAIFSILGTAFGMLGPIIAKLKLHGVELSVAMGLLISTSLLGIFSALGVEGSLAISMLCLLCSVFYGVGLVCIYIRVGHAPK
ncbi:hypothetical protein [Stutzerimonas nitrititolerans]|uniref:hypothetical protein n=1 Tax=Stutzerimonas nitrititolerans TaxID=2482751 RepID=UPI0028A9A296|nr:hypothetical protein [Stutzerimonas nitrititolerans]